MKKITLISLALSLLLTGCFYDSEPSPAATNPDADAPKEVSVTIDNKQQATVLPATDPSIPSTDDGSIYIQALTSHKSEDCIKIANKELEEKCIEVVTGKKR